MMRPREYVSITYRRGIALRRLSWSDTMLGWVALWPIWQGELARSGSTSSSSSSMTWITCPIPLSAIFPHWHGGGYFIIKPTHGSNESTLRYTCSFPQQEFSTCEYQQLRPMAAWYMFSRTWEYMIGNSSIICKIVCINCSPWITTICWTKAVPICSPPCMYVLRSTAAKWDVVYHDCHGTMMLLIRLLSVHIYCREKTLQNTGGTSITLPKLISMDTE